MADRLFHLALPQDWAQAQVAGSYAMSTRGAPLSEVGFIHLSFESQWPTTRAAFYADVSVDLLLLELDAHRLGDDVVVEVGNPQTGELFPHLYSALPVDAVLEVTRLPPPHA